MRRRNRKGFFFTLDAALALSVLIFGFLIMFSAYLKEPQPNQAMVYSKDILELFSNSQIKNLENDYVFNLHFTSGPRCTNPLNKVHNVDHTLFQQLAEFVAEGEIDIARNLTMNVSQGLVRKQYNWELRIKAPNNVTTLIWNNTQSNFTKGDVLIAAKDVIYFIDRDFNLQGPYVGEVNVWR